MDAIKKNGKSMLFIFLHLIFVTLCVSG